MQYFNFSFVIFVKTILQNGRAQNNFYAGYTPCDD